MKRAAGILLPVSALPSPYGIGSLGKAAYEFVDFLATAGQRYWQILPIGPTGYGDSPYQSFSAFAANPYFIDLDTLAAQGLLRADSLARVNFGTNEKTIDYARLYETRFALLKKAAQNFEENTPGFQSFCAQNAHWLPDYALFMAIKSQQGEAALETWPAPLRKREAVALAAAQKELSEQIRFWQIVQYWFSVQWQALKAYASAKGVQIIGDIPIYVSPDSADLWAHPELFQVNGDGALTEVAGCPPDAFSAEGQLWGNPLYQWDYHAKTNFAWWVQRLRHACMVYDVVRIDHFRGFAGYYAIPADAPNAIRGHWRNGPGKAFVQAIKAQLPNAQIIAEDLGFLTPDVLELMNYSGYPGMKVLQFAFDSREESDYLPHNYSRNCVVYTGTHDNATTVEWETTAPANDVAFAKSYLGVYEAGKLPRAMIRAAFASVADTAIIPLQDWLELDAHARINTPSTLGGNWQWRTEQTALTPRLAQEIYAFTKRYGRASAL